MAATIAWRPAPGTGSRHAASAHPKLRARPDLLAPELAELAALDDAAFRARFSASPVKRIGRDRFVRNVLIAIGNSGDPALLPSARRLLDDPDPVVAEAASWAVQRLDPVLAKRSVTLAGHRTSVALEPEFWAALESLAADQGVALAALVAGVDAARPSGQPLASALRLAALRHGLNRFLIFPSGNQSHAGQGTAEQEELQWNRTLLPRSALSFWRIDSSPWRRMRTAPGCARRPGRIIRLAERVCEERPRRHCAG